MPVPHPFPYQGSKRAIANAILRYLPRDTARLIEPFCGSAAISIAASARRLASEFWLNDLNEPLMRLWSSILDTPEELAQGYSMLWIAQRPDRKAFFYKVRQQFNKSPRPDLLLYLLARIVKGSVRYSASGEFNQSPDNRRSGMRPSQMRRQILGVSFLLAKKTTATSKDFREVVQQASERDTLYLDPPYQGTSFTRDHRYRQGLPLNELVNALSEMNGMGLSYILSYDGRTGEKTHGKPLPSELGLFHLTIPAGRSTQATLLGLDLETVESLYLSPALVERLGSGQLNSEDSPRWGQRELTLG